MIGCCIKFGYNKNFEIFLKLYLSSEKNLMSEITFTHTRSGGDGIPYAHSVKHVTGSSAIIRRNLYDVVVPVNSCIIGFDKNNLPIISPYHQPQETN
jgi:hypothetical protein